jgi:hypothetical protein
MLSNQIIPCFHVIHVRDSTIDELLSSNQRHESGFREHRLFSGHLAPQGVEKASVVHGTSAPR